jgi:hypothetical protein
MTIAVGVAVAVVVSVEVEVEVAVVGSAAHGVFAGPPYVQVSTIPPSPSAHVQVPLQVVSMHAQLGVAPHVAGNEWHVASVPGPIPSLQYDSPGVHDPQLKPAGAEPPYPPSPRHGHTHTLRSQSADCPTREPPHEFALQTGATPLHDPASRGSAPASVLGSMPASVPGALLPTAPHAVSCMTVRLAEPREKENSDGDHLRHLIMPARCHAPLCGSTERPPAVPKCATTDDPAISSPTTPPIARDRG